MRAVANSSKIIPANARPFILRGLALVIGWNLLYQLLLKPIGIPDNQLTAAVQYATVKLLSLFFDSATEVGLEIYINGADAIGIAPQCNGLELMVLYIGFLFCIPTNWRRMLAFGLTGIVVIYLLNVVRCSLLGAMYYNHYDWSDFAHHYAFKLVIYAVVFYGWMLYAKKPAHEA